MWLRKRWINLQNICISQALDATTAEKWQELTAEQLCVAVDGSSNLSPDQCKSLAPPLTSLYIILYTSSFSVFFSLSHFETDQFQINNQ